MSDKPLGYSINANVPPYADLRPVMTDKCGIQLGSAGTHIQFDCHVARDLRAEVKRLEGELMDANPGDLKVVRAHAANLELAIAETWRPEVKALRAEVQFVKSQNEQLHEQLNEIRRVVWEGPGTAQIMNKLRNMMDRPK